MIYNDKIENLFFDTQHAGELNCAKPLTICSRMSLNNHQLTALYLACDEKGWITQAYFKALGDPYLIASFEFLCRQIEHTPLDSHPCVDHAMMVDALLIPKNKYAAAVLVETNYRQAIKLLKQSFLEKNNE